MPSFTDLATSYLATRHMTAGVCFVLLVVSAPVGLWPGPAFAQAPNTTPTVASPPVIDAFVQPIKRVRPTRTVSAAQPRPVVKANPAGATATKRSATVAATRTVTNTAPPSALGMPPTRVVGPTLCPTGKALRRKPATPGQSASTVVNVCVASTSTSAAPPAHTSKAPPAQTSKARPTSTPEVKAAGKAKAVPSPVAVGPSVAASSGAASSPVSPKR